jgi:hypothetical protein
MHMRGAFGGMHGPMAVFQEFDADKDGKIARAELDGGIDTRFAKSDANTDAKLDETEFKTLVPPHGDGIRGRWASHHDEMIKRAFRALDTNGDAAVNADEIKAAAHIVSGFADSDGDGAVARDEIPGPMHRGRWRRDN